MVHIAGSHAETAVNVVAAAKACPLTVEAPLGGDETCNVVPLGAVTDPKTDAEFRSPIRVIPI
jgi:hypothetical protein